MNTEYYHGDLEFIVEDNALDLAEFQQLARDYPPRTGGTVRIISACGGPAAGGPGWGGPEIAVVVMGELLRRLSSDVYGLLKSFILDKYSLIRTRDGARWYIEGAFALAVDSKIKALTILFCFPEGMSQDELKVRIRRVEDNFEAVLAEWRARSWVREGGPKKVIKVCWDADSSSWRECQPPPPEDEDRAREMAYYSP